MSGKYSWLDYLALFIFRGRGKPKRFNAEKYVEIPMGAYAITVKASDYEARNEA